MEWYWQGTTEVQKKSVPLLLCPPQILHSLAWNGTRVSEARPANNRLSREGNERIYTTYSQLLHPREHYVLPLEVTQEEYRKNITVSYNNHVESTNIVKYLDKMKIFSVRLSDKYINNQTWRLTAKYCHFFAPRRSWIQFTCWHCISIISSLILHTLLNIGMQNALSFWCFQTKILYDYLIYPKCVTCLAHFVLPYYKS